MNKHNPFWKRRAFLKAMAAGAGVASVGPMILVPRHSHATPAFGAVKHLFVINLDGGMRSTCLFNSDVSEKWNPRYVEYARLCGRTPHDQREFDRASKWCRMKQ